MTTGLFASLDLWVIGYAAGMALTASGLTIWRSRNAQRVQGLHPLIPFASAIPDTVTGMFVGTVAGILGPELWKTLDNLSGISLAAGLGGILGPKLWDLISSKGLNVVLNAMPGSIGKALAAQNQPPATPPPTQQEVTHDQQNDPKSPG